MDVSFPSIVETSSVTVVMLSSEPVVVSVLLVSCEEVSGPIVPSVIFAAAGVVSAIPDTVVVFTWGALDRKLGKLQNVCYVD